MKKQEIKVGGFYVAKLSGKLVTVRVDAIRESGKVHASNGNYYDVTNLITKRRTTFRSAQKFRQEAKLCSNCNMPRPPCTCRPSERAMAASAAILDKADSERNKAANDAADKAAAARRKAEGKKPSDPPQPPPQRGSKVGRKKVGRNVRASGGKRLPTSMTSTGAAAGTGRESSPSPATTPPSSLDAAAATPAALLGNKLWANEEVAERLGVSEQELQEAGATARKHLSSPPDPTSAAASAAKIATAPSASAAGPVSAAGTSPVGPSPLTSLLRRSIEQVNREKADRAAAVKGPHLIVQALAGTGKTTTLIEGLKRLKGLPTPIDPSPQQAAIWEQLEQSRDAKTVCFVAFNKSIATELQRRVPPGCEACTMHSLGFRAVTKALGRQEPNSRAVQDLIAEELQQDLRWLRSNKPVLLKATEELVGLCKMNLTEWEIAATGGPTPTEWATALDQLATHYDVDLNGSKKEVYDLVPRVLERCKTPQGRITFDDMIWLPVVLDLPVPKFDLLLIDESQDLSKCQQTLARKAGERLVLVGDVHQAIYAFAGADSRSMARMAEELSNDSRGLITLPLTVTRRCGKAIVEEARKIVPEFEAHETNPEGRISYASFTTERSIAPRESAGCEDGPTLPGKPCREHEPTGHGRNPPTGVLIHGPGAVGWNGGAGYSELVQNGDFILCRTNAPLVRECFRFLKSGRKANIQGRDVGAGLISTIKKLKAGSVPDLISKLTDWLATEQRKENAKRFPSEAKLTSLQDRVDCLICFTEGAATTEDVIRKIEAIFTDDKDRPGIRLSSIHKAKGLESKRVYYLKPPNVGPRLDKMQPWELEQHWNLEYVAITRAIEFLCFVS